MEQEAITVMLQAMVKGSEMLFSIGKIAGKGAVKTAAFTKAYWNKATERGRVSMMRLMKRGGPYETIELPQSKLEEFDKICRKANIPYTTMQKGETAVVMMNRQDFIDIAPAMEYSQMDVKKSAEEKAAVNEIQGEQYAEAKKPAVNEVQDEQKAMTISRFDEIVNANKENSVEAQMINDEYWPKLKEQGDLSVTTISSDDYLLFKENNGQQIPFAACKSDGDTIMLAYRSSDEQALAGILQKPVDGKSLNADRINLSATEIDAKNWKVIANEEVGIGSPAAVDKANEVSNALLKEAGSELAAVAPPEVAL